MVRTLEQMQWAGETVETLQRAMMAHESRRELAHRLGTRNVQLWWQRSREMAEELGILKAAAKPNQ